MCKVSILMPVYNAEKYLAEAIDSILSQTYSNWELIIINDGSTDSSKKIIKSYTDPRIKCYDNEQNIGLIKTLNKGIDLCKSKYIARMDADDIAHPKRIEKQVELMSANPQLIICGTNAHIINNGGIIGKQIINPTSKSLLQISLLFTNPFIHPSVMIRKERMGDAKFDEQALHIEDFELWTRLANKGELANIKELLLKYRWHNTNVSVKHTATQEQAKSELIRRQLIEQLDIEPTDKELELHQLTFKLYRLGEKSLIATANLNEISKWFEKISARNKEVNRYPRHDFDAFLWSRWIVLCAYTNKKGKSLFPPFIKFNLKTLFKTLNILIYLSKK